MEFIDESFELVRTLIDPEAARKKDVNEIDRRFREAFSSYVSLTPDNEAAIQRVRFGLYRDHDGSNHYGLGLEQEGVLLADLLVEIEADKRIREILLSKFPSLSKEGWAAAIRVVVLLMLSTGFRVVEADDEIFPWPPGQSD